MYTIPKGRQTLRRLRLRGDANKSFEKDGAVVCIEIPEPHVRQDKPTRAQFWLWLVVMLALEYKQGDHRHVYGDHAKRQDIAHELSHVSRDVGRVAVAEFGEPSQATATSTCLYC
jgi:hypothetical protein